MALARKLVQRAEPVKEKRMHAALKNLPSGHPKGDFCITGIFLPKPCPQNHAHHRSARDLCGNIHYIKDRL